MQPQTDASPYVADLIARSFELEQRVQQLQHVINGMKVEIQQTIDARHRELDKLSDPETAAV